MGSAGYETHIAIVPICGIPASTSAPACPRAGAVSLGGHSQMQKATNKKPTKLPWPVTHGIQFLPWIGSGHGPLMQPRLWRQCGIDGREHTAHGAAQGVYNSDDRHRNTGRDQGVFDGGGAGLVGKKPLDDAAQLDLPRGVRPAQPLGRMQKP
jgi:hypothetical protein